MERGAKDMFNVEELALAYRKAKVDLFFSALSKHVDIVDYEKSLIENLTQLCHWINHENDDSWVNSEFVGGFRVAPKSVDVAQAPCVEGNAENRIFSAPNEEWDWFFGENATNSGAALSDEHVATAHGSLRLISDCSIHMHVLSALWIKEVGAFLDDNLSDSVRGYRLRRDRNRRFNALSQGNFEPYLRPYKKWRDDGFREIEKALYADKSVYCLTADATEYFHRIDPTFLSRDTSFYSLIKDAQGKQFEFSDRQKRIHDTFIKSLQVWQEKQQENLGSRGLQASVRGLPVGLPASGLVANLALLEFDRKVRTEVRPLYYGRYVDDIILVWEDLSKTDDEKPLQSVQDVWYWLHQKFERESPEDSTPVLSSVELGENSRTSTFRFQPGYHSESEIDFSNSKNRLYSMHGKTGLSLLNTLRSTAGQRSSEWRMMPELPRDETAVGTMVSRARNSDGDSADSLSGLAGITMNRSSFALTLRDFEAFARDLEEGSWRRERQAFFQAVRDYVFTPSSVFEMDGYIERVFSLALSCGDFDEFCSLADAFLEASTKIQKTASIKVAGVVKSDSFEDVSDAVRSDFDRTLRAVVQPDWFLHLRTKIFNSISRTVHNVPSETADKISQIVEAYEIKWAANLDASDDRKYSDASWFLRILQPATSERSDSGDLFSEIFYRDLGTQPFRQELLPTDSVPVGFTSPEHGFSADASPLELLSDDRHEQVKAFLDMLVRNANRRSERVDEYMSGPETRSTETDGRFYAQLQHDGSVLLADLRSLWALLFPTRPFTAAELFEISDLFRIGPTHVDSTANLLRESLLVTRGYSVQVEALAGVRTDRSDKDRHYVKLSTTNNFQFDDDSLSNPIRATNNGVEATSDRFVKEASDGRIRIAVTMLETPWDYVQDALREKPNLSASRYRALTKVVNQAIRLTPKPDYLVLGELALPQRWYNAVAMKLASAGISLIAGVEYIHVRSNPNDKKTVRNQVWASLRHGALGHPARSVYKQDKQVAAHGERENLVRQVNAELVPEYKWETPPIISHDNHIFGFLICSELTNINHRASLRGNIDTLFVPQWNRDLNTFTALVESAALDLHAHVVQVNNRAYGDTRIRMPAGDEHWLRDLVQLKGGLNDYLVLAELDLKSLRNFQSKFSSPSSKYKPVPDGFEKALNRE